MNAGRGVIARGIVLVVTIVSMMALATGCSAFAEPPQREDLLGTWEAHDGTRVARMELRGDGSLRIEGLPRDAITRESAQALDWSDTIDATGEWSFFEPDPGPFGYPTVYLSVDGAESAGVFSAFPLDVGPATLELGYGDIEIGAHLTFRFVPGSSLSSPETVARADLVGEWVSDGGGRLELLADGGFTLTGVPLSIAAVDGDETDPTTLIDLAGQWTFAETPMPLDDHGGVTLSFHDVYGSDPQLFDTWGLSLRESEDGFTLTFEGKRVSWELR